MFALTDCTLFDGEQLLEDMALVIKQDRIVAIQPQATLAADLPRHSLNGALLSAGFIDLQLNGCGGVMFNDDISSTTLETMHRTNLKSGTTSFLPTLITSPDRDMQQAVRVTRNYMARHQHRVPGLHLEGPYTNLKRKGIHPAAQIRPLDEPMLDFLCRHAAVIAKITLAPECNSPAHIRRLKEAGILVAMGHTAASYDEAMAGFDAGIGFATHLYNAMTPTLNGREPGAVGAVFDNDSIYAGIIVDGFHVHDANVRLAHQVLGPRLCLVTDATAAAGAGPELTQFDFCGTTVLVRDGRCVDQHGTLGGSALTMIEGVRNLVERVGLPLEEALRMASLYPARALGLDHELGSIAVGKVANLVVLNKQLDVTATLVNGRFST
ncbi:N-acetylglucosamine-6-phosphate deacetylase [Oceanisphaera arctica]|uniref:N-acetylglucosamine-6-phosphate deacetylase n=1 Tax=Oceanisphaera arctica TaxID=641510 RepID=A0A2P5TPS0_9GAMM|nr:N-acetylglucosamine-6-phosphate deacetylase [Oceanisphaera arctica]PPL17709.1 N-acetylglucosamine-6-phosphate deacetylase [Oceanisphaera arctica]GHA18526.1 N-acetylglucosamine-6-phosphate deacetylase [Oceanisphaera arctica]